MKKLITTSLAPNADSVHVRNALSFVLNPFKWKKIKHGKSIASLESEVGKYMNVKHVTTFNSGRAALYFSLKALGVKKGDEVILQAYTCISVPNAITALDANPIYCDIDNEYNIDVNELEKHISKKTKVIITQNTFGNPAQIEAIQKIAKKHNVFILEDIAHALGAEYNHKKIGSFGDVAIASFGRDKVISGIAGGAALTSDQNLYKKISAYQERLEMMSTATIIKNLLYPFWSTCIKKTYYFFAIGKIANAMARKIKLLPKVIDQNERCGSVDIATFKKIPNSFAFLALRQLKKIESIHESRIKKAHKYNELLKNDILKPEHTHSNAHIYLRYTIQITNPEELKQKMKAEGIYLGNWYDAVIAPKNVDATSVGYHKGSAKHAEKMAGMSVNLPNHFAVTDQDQKKIAEIVNSHVDG